MFESREDAWPVLARARTVALGALHLTGCRIACGTSAGNLTQLVALLNLGLTTAVIANVAAGGWSFAVKVLSHSDSASDCSSAGSKTNQ